MIRAKPHQQQQPRAVNCPYCANQFNNVRRLMDHIRAKQLCASAYEKDFGFGVGKARTLGESIHARKKFLDKAILS